MPGENCCMNGCGVSRRKGANNPDGKIGLFKIPAAKDEKSKQWRKELLNIITKYREQDESFKRQLANDTLHICEKHFVPEDITTHHGAKLTKKFLKFGVLPTKELPKKSMDHHFPDQSQKSRPPRSIVKDSDPTDREKSCYKDFKDVCSRVKKLSIKDWHVDVSEDKIEIKKHQVPYILPRLCVEINESLCFTIYVFNWRIPVDHFLYKQFKRTLKLITISELLRIIENLNICKGHSALSHSGKSIQHSIPLFLEEDNEDNPSYAAKHFYRAKYCEVLIKGENCMNCQERERLFCKDEARRSARQAVPAKLKAPVSMTSAKRLKLTLQANRLKCRQLESKVEEMEKEVARHSVHVQSDLSHDLLQLISRHGGSMSPFMKLFWQQQQKNASRMPKGQRYHPMIIRWCLSIASKSSAAYDEIRGTFKGTGTIELPSRRQLRDYSNAIKPKTGFNPDVIQSLETIVLDYRPTERFVVLLFDEMKVQSGLVWDKTTGELIGYVDLGDPDVNYATLDSQDNIATHALVFMVRGICSKLQFVLGYFATAAVTSCQLFPLFWKAVAILELRCNLAVVAATADGATANRRFFKMHEGVSNHNERDVVHKASNIYANERYIFFFSDAPTS
ncbi:uncharacterized protein LOC135691144 [Rhopilema esculentum]|uniref:uncharacterized protein LOC135691144 n=1 Tax=Rhopilema esculentum TaxID=499914 RepID=UPI0031DE2B9F|eukprot:gene1840-16331_t